MAGIPYIDLPSILGIDSHAVTLAAAILLGHYLLSARTQRPAFSASLILGAVAGCLALHYYLTGRLGGATLGGLLGATAAGALYPHPNKLQLFNAAAWAFPFPWILVRLGCFLAHDQQARPHHGPLAVNYPTGPCHDLALYEILYAATLAVIFFQSRQKQWPFAAILVTTYGILRLTIHPLRLTQHTIDFTGAALVLAAGLTWLLYFSRPEQQS
jgi:prolipoprotein diacylglyceryltransferase